MAEGFGRNLRSINDRSEGYRSKINEPKERTQPKWADLSKEYHSEDTDRNVDH